MKTGFTHSTQSAQGSQSPAARTFTELCALCVLCANLFSDAFAAEPVETPKPQPTAPSAAEPQAPAKQAPKKEEEAAKAPAEAIADKAPSPQRFVPSEQVRADFDVSFPIDI